jgi:cell division septation protein DedD
MDNKATTKRMIGAVVLVLVAALLLAWLLKGKNREGQDMAMQQTTDTKPILGFPSAEDGTQKPSLVGEDPNAAQNSAQQQTLDPSALATAATAAVGNVIPNVNVEPNTTGFDVRPAASGETRPVVDIDGKVTKATGSLGAGDATPATTGDTADTSTSVVATPSKTDTATKAPAISASVKDVPAEAPAEKKPAAPKPVLVNERAVPAPASAESKAKEDAAKKAKAAAEKAAAAKSLELAKAATSASAKPATGGGVFAVQLLATSDKAKADTLAKTFASEGYKAAVNTVKVDGKTVHRVVVGSYADKVAASAAQAKMKARYTQNRDVQNSFVTSSK